MPAQAEHRSDVDDVALGWRLRKVRVARGLALNHVARQASLSIGLLSQIERGISSPSIRVLRNICQILDISVSELFPNSSDAPADELGVIVRRSERRILHFGSKGLTKEVLTPPDARRLQLLEVILRPGAGSGLDPYAHEGEETGVVIAGKLELWIDGSTFHLRKGDSFYFESRRQHRFRNPHRSEARVLWLASPPLY